MSIFASRHEKYAGWPVVIWHRVFGHGLQLETWWEGETCRCAVCGDPLLQSDRAKAEREG